MAENMIPEVIPGMVAVQYAGQDNKDSGEKAGMVKNVFPVDAKEMIASGQYKLVDNGAVEAARINATSLRLYNPVHPSKLVVADVAGIASQLHLAKDEQEAEKAKATSEQAKPAQAPATAQTAPKPPEKK